MKEKTLLKIALITSLAGLLIIFLISGNINLSEENIGKITIDNQDDFVKVKGIVNSMIDTEKVMIIEISQLQSIKVVMFKNNVDIPITEGNEIEIIGKVDEYEGSLEIIAQRARVIR
ncbi:hypothetical protein ISS07_02735 [Candidatus Woesearchaeota archaeon]|nr:hypothetical protein [Candidatus Woesearchaeota archaeon]